ncbi:hypothetical protein BWQ96_07141 [Gracilariopsis chorda]|uniref:Uncharacterized protein n=1 Tax=Gracilariopsis chorda TaxID=448386 RepID=A0A2V3IM34_9FLOR|nr:hypothetical protein BWQ96_07141 [Gracilariopsis chorda]|eukprot:PXF43107.1 hypothetical protein BWQ96_07141 [Gracilariopsis chorda]
MCAPANGAFLVGPQNIGGVMRITQFAQHNVVLRVDPSGTQRLPVAAWEHWNKLGDIQHPGAAAVQFVARQLYQQLVNEEGARPWGTNTIAHVAGGVHYADQNILHSYLRVATAEAKASQPTAVDGDGKTIPAEADGTCSLPPGVQASIADPNSSAAGGSSVVGTPGSPVEEGRRTPPKEQAGLNSSAKKARRGDGGISKASGAGQREAKREPRTYSQAAPRQHCHTCFRLPTTNAPHMMRGNLLRSRCRKTTYAKCFERYNWDLEAARDAKAGIWMCTHCRGECPTRALCVIYSRTSDPRWMKLINYRKNGAGGAGNGASEDGKVSPVAGPSQGPGDRTIVGRAEPVGFVSSPPAFCVDLTVVEATGSAFVVEGGGRKAGSPRGCIDEDAGVWKGGVGKSVGAMRMKAGYVRRGGKPVARPRWFWHDTNRISFDR